MPYSSGLLILGTSHRDEKEAKSGVLVLWFHMSIWVGIGLKRKWTLSAWSEAGTLRRDPETIKRQAPTQGAPGFVGESRRVVRTGKIQHPDGWEFALHERRINLSTDSLSITETSGRGSPAWECDLAQGKKISVSWLLPDPRGAGGGVGAGR